MKKITQGRCVCCDWSPEVPSVFHTSIPEAPIQLREFRSELYCNVCLEQVRDLMGDFTLEELDELAFLLDLEAEETPSDLSPHEVALYE
jgi:hypothetical protein